MVASRTDKFIEFQEKCSNHITELVAERGCQPVFFMGSGLSRRYFEAPNWLELLKLCALQIAIETKEFAKISQECGQQPVRIGTALADATFKYAWTDGKDKFPAEYFSDQSNKELFFKSIVREVIEQHTPKEFYFDSSPHSAEIDSLRKCRPHAIVTTNYDVMIENLFPKYKTIVGQKIITSHMNMIGEILKIHGSVQDIESLVITEADYENFNRTRRYLTSKLLTYLAEHPVFIFGYSIGDENIARTMSDLAEIVGDDNRLIPNIYYVQWTGADKSADRQQEEQAFSSAGRSFRVRTIVTDDFTWIFDAIRKNAPLHPIDIGLLRTLVARTYKITHDINADNEKTFNFSVLENIDQDEALLPKLLGISSEVDINIQYPFLTMDVAVKLGFGKKSHAKVTRMIQNINAKYGKDIKATTNRYHYSIKTGTNTATHRYSTSFLEILKKFKRGEDIVIEI